MTIPTLDSVKAAYAKYGYKWNTEEGHINLCAFRCANPVSDAFNDIECAAWTYQGKEYFYTYSITTDPGTYWLKKPMNVNGTACLKEGFYPDCWELGTFEGQYTALIQKGNLTVIRELKRDGACAIAIPDLSQCRTKTYAGSDNDVITDWLDANNNLVWRESTGKTYCICNHHAGVASTVNYNWSAGCQVFAILAQFNEFIGFCQASAKLNSNSFNYALFNENDLIPATT